MTEVDMTINEILSMVKSDYPDYIIWAEPFPSRNTDNEIKDVQWVPNLMNIKTCDGEMLELCDEQIEAFIAIYAHLTDMNSMSFEEFDEDDI